MTASGIYKQLGRAQTVGDARHDAPGGRRARKNGCTCSVKANEAGAGFEAQGVYIVNSRCPLHMPLGWHTKETRA